MCLRLRPNDNRPKIATEPITCYKILNKNLTSVYHREFKWTVGKTYTSSLRKDKLPIRPQEVNIGLHSYPTIGHAKDAYCYSPPSSLIAECIIPKGARYYEGIHTAPMLNGYASNKLKIIKIINPRQK